MENAFRRWFPKHHVISCAKHIQENVKTLYGKAASQHVISLSKSFSTRQEQYFLEKIGGCKKKAREYVEKIPKEVWRSTAWMSEKNLPPRFGIVTSNSAESTNSWILKERNDDTWMDILSSFVEKDFKKYCKEKKGTRE